jgi:hypothetical protein
MSKSAKADSKAVSIAKAEVKKTKKTPSKKVYSKPSTPKKWSEDRWVLAGVGANAYNEEGEAQVIKVPVLKKWLFEFCPFAGESSSTDAFLNKKVPEILESLVKQRLISTKRKSFKLKPRGAKRFLKFDRPVKVLQYASSRKKALLSEGSEDISKCSSKKGVKCSSSKGVKDVKVSKEEKKGVKVVKEKGAVKKGK